MAKDIYRTAAWQKVRREVLIRDGYTCQLRWPGCTHHANTVDHTIGHQQGGAWYDPANLKAACSHCNGAKANSERKPQYATTRTW